jgi:hypothetical protein
MGTGMDFDKQSSLPNAKRRWLQFRLKTLLVLVTVFAFALAWWCDRRCLTQRHRESLAALQPNHEYTVSVDNERFRLRLCRSEVGGTADRVQYELQAARGRRLSGRLRLTGNVILTAKSFRAIADSVDYDIDSDLLTLSARSGNQVQLWPVSAKTDAQKELRGTRIEIDLSTNRIHVGTPEVLGGNEVSDNSNSQTNEE